MERNQGGRWVKRGEGEELIRPRKWASANG